jgi:hypothetical protein
VILNITYAAGEDAALRRDVESQNAAVAGKPAALPEQPFAHPRVQSAAGILERLQWTDAGGGTPVTFEITERHFALFIQGRALTTSSAHIVLAVEDHAAAIGPVSISANGTEASAFPAATDPPAAGNPFGGLPNKAIAAQAFAAGLKTQHSITIINAGNFAQHVPGTEHLPLERALSVQHAHHPHRAAGVVEDPLVFTQDVARIPGGEAFDEGFEDVRQRPADQGTHERVQLLDLEQMAHRIATAGNGALAAVDDRRLPLRSRYG